MEFRTYDVMGIAIEFDWFIGFGVSYSKAEYWRMIVLHFPFIAIYLSLPTKSEEIGEEDDIEERRRL